MIETNAAELARLLRTAQQAGTRVPRAAAPGLDAAAGHAVQTAGRALRVAEGDRQAGWKVGLTTEAAQATVSATGPVSGYLVGSTVTAVAPTFDATLLPAPRVEVEVAFVLAGGLQGPDLTAADVLAATAYLAPALEIVDSRWEGGPDGVGALLADDVSAAAVVVGQRVDPDAVALPELRVTGRVGATEVSGGAENVFGDPARAVAWLCADLHRRGEGLRAGDLVLSGALCGPTPVRVGDAVEADLGALGRLRTEFVTSA
ncbi:2-keto-4-pentenoate hydratase [Pseudonocardia kunmingensis]|uniref:2-keto-4-pentenoate hydratase n=1 Tax=Pseudonocardia kunmingensis TaxID=630975 RepID=A0A543D0T0_9PSEU|nr:fumarylacetoacetate hydrolase family protein [Pseudonocardia kunmingensis]TQM02953.1 2-keto-4-pentenoate hydratase [Pseudonocardia kunmingensis]